MERWSTTMNAAGEIVLPADAARVLGVEPGQPIEVEAERGQLKISSVAARVARAQAIVRALVPVDVSLADELIAERRAEAMRE